MPRGRPLGSKNKVKKNGQHMTKKSGKKVLRTRITKKVLLQEKIKLHEEPLSLEGKETEKPINIPISPSVVRESTFEKLYKKYGDLITNPDFINFLAFYHRAEELEPERAIQIFKDLMLKGNKILDD